MAESFGNVPITHRAPAEYTPPNQFMVFQENTERRLALTECVSHIAGRSLRGSS